MSMQMVPVSAGLAHAEGSPIEGTSIPTIQVDLQSKNYSARPMAEVAQTTNSLCRDVLILSEMLLASGASAGVAYGGYELYYKDSSAFGKGFGPWLGLLGGVVAGFFAFTSIAWTGYILYKKCTRLY